MQTTFGVHSESDECGSSRKYLQAISESNRVPSAPQWLIALRFTWTKWEYVFSMRFFKNLFLFIFHISFSIVFLHFLFSLFFTSFLFCSFFFSFPKAFENLYGDASANNGKIKGKKFQNCGKRCNMRTEWSSWCGSRKSSHARKMMATTHSFFNQSGECLMFFFVSFK